MILIGCPVQNRDWVLDEYLDHIYALDWPKKDIMLYFIINNSTDRSAKILKTFRNNHLHEYYSIKIDEVTTGYSQDIRTAEVRRNSTYYLLADLRNKLLDAARLEGASFFLSCDSDILIRPDTLFRLHEHNVPAISSLVYNGYLAAPTEPQRYPNILKYDEDLRVYIHIQNWYLRNTEKIPYGKTLSVDFTGACILIRSDMFDKSYAYYERGEDEPFCRAVRPYGLYCDISLFSRHIMSKKLLEEYHEELHEQDRKE